MSKIETKWACGNFEVKLGVQVDATSITPKEQALFEAGIRWFGQRNSEVDKILGGFEMVNGKSKRKASFKRNDVPYSADLAAKLKESFAALEYAKGQKLAEAVEVTEYVRDTGEDPKFTLEREKMASHESANDLEEWLKTAVGYTGETHGEDGEFSIEALTAIRVKVRAIKAEAARLAKAL